MNEHHLEHSDSGRRIDHAAASDLLPFYASGALAADERLAVADHLATCADCREELALWSAVGGVVAESAAALPAPSAVPLLGALREIREAAKPSVSSILRTEVQQHATRAEALGGRGLPAAPSAAGLQSRECLPTALTGSAPMPGQLARFWRAARDSFAFAVQLLRSQAPLVRRELWPTSALAMALGLIVAFLVPAADQSGAIIGALAPLVAAAGVALAADPADDPARELMLATRTSPRQVLLARMAIVYGYDFALALAATVALVAILPPSLLGGIALDWLGPMAFLSALALVLSLKLGTGAAIGISFSVWFSRWIGRGAFNTAGFLPDGLASAAHTYDVTWANTPLLLASACVLLVVAVWLAGRQEPAINGFGG